MRRSRKPGPTSLHPTRASPVAPVFAVLCSGCVSFIAPCTNLPATTLPLAALALYNRVISTPGKQTAPPPVIKSAYLKALPAVLLAGTLIPAGAQAQTYFPAFSSSVLPASALPASTLPAPKLPDAPIPQESTKAPVTTPAQTTTQPPPNETDAQRKAREAAESQAALKKEEQQRLLGVVPNFNVVYEGQVVRPLTPGQKFNLAIHTTIDPFTIGYAFLFGGGVGELEDSHPGFGHGPAGYFKLVGANYADTVNGALIGNALLPVLLHQDPRYFRQGHGTIKSRFVHAALSTVICHGDNGKNQVNVSNILGNFISGAISNAYYPAEERGIGLTLSTGLEVTAYGAVGGQILEFAPDIINHYKRKHAAAAAAKAAATGAVTTP